ncbi:UDP-N-acetylmuramoyl-L-alanyl-D-glutamate--2,6-diaminopimelate ligase [Proteinivorax hydrogeniformans]|uniref:UDP-N-acetylmuramyl-tripeptide synthetase n=1 Tax=Proteinivorax hydrogeniformans TaxID=1826727 RepID=A0AAU8HRV7_9FIRM
MKLANIIKHLEAIDIKGNIKIEIKGLAYNSSSVKDNYVFVAIEGFQVDGHKYIKDAISNGAKAIVVSRDIEVSEDITVIKVKDTRVALSNLSAAFYRQPSKNLELIGVTGTNGKTTTIYFVKSVLEASKRNTSLIGTVETIINGKSFCSSHTTPESLALQGMFNSMLLKKVDTCVMEVSSHSLQLSRVNDCDFNIGIFTNLTHEHLDFHGSMENYYSSKKQLFYNTNDFNIVNIDDYYGSRLATELKSHKTRLLTYGINNDADINAKDILFYKDCSEYTINTPTQKVKFKTRIPGLYNIYNSLAAVACGFALGIDLQQIKKGIEAVTSIPGRFQVIPTDKDLNIIVDYAHTPDGFENVLRTISEYAKGRIIIVFGCVGERDYTKRSKMGQIAQRYCDLSILTTDNCRSEDPKSIVNEIKKGFNKGDKPYIEILDREEAIRYAIINSSKEDTIIITGKGHEKRQIIGDKTIYFNEREIAKQALKELELTSLKNSKSLIHL